MWYLWFHLSAASYLQFDSIAGMHIGLYKHKWFVICLVNLVRSRLIDSHNSIDKASAALSTLFNVSRSYIEVVKPSDYISSKIWYASSACEGLKSLKWKDNLFIQLIDDVKKVCLFTAIVQGNWIIDNC